MLAEFVLDLSDLKIWLVTGLFVISIFSFAIPLLKKLPDWLSGVSGWIPSGDSNIPTSSGTGSDKPAPEGIQQYLTMIKETAPNADYAVWWDYAELALTQAQVAMDEAKLAPQDRKGANQ